MEDPTRQALPGWPCFSIGLLVSVIVLVLFGPAILLQVLSVAALVVVAWRLPEVILALFLTAGAYKLNPAIAAAFPGDPTIVLAMLLVVAIARKRHIPSIRPPLVALLLLPLLLLTVMGMWGGVSEYGTQKALRFGTLSVLAMFGCVSLLRERSSFSVFLLSLAWVAVSVTVLAAIGQQTDSTARLRMAGTSPITLARMSIVTLTFCWLTIRMLPASRRSWLLLPIAIIALYVALATGSRGPIVSFGLGLVLLETISRRYHARSLLARKWLLGFGVAVLLLVVSGVIPVNPLDRFHQILVGGHDNSLSQRLSLYETSLHLLMRNPFGIGIGGFSEHAILNLRYPHNVFLEVGVELGWVPMLCLLILTVWSAVSLFLVLRAECSWTTCLLAMVVVMSGINAMVTGDINDNRMFFALILVPFLYRATQPGIRGLERPRVAPRGLNLATPR